MAQRIIYLILKILPFNYLRIIVYRKILGYNIGKNVYIGSCKLKCSNVIIEDNVYIGNGNKIICKDLFLGNGSKIISKNSITGKANFKLGKNSRIINNHIIDVWNNVTIGKNTWIAGCNSQLWTHGSLQTKLKKKDLSIHLGDDIYISSGVLIAPGVNIENLNLIGLGSVVTKSIETSKNIVIGNPSKIVKTDIDWRENW